MKAKSVYKIPKGKLIKIDLDYDPTDRAGILCILEEANANHELLTGLLYINTKKDSLYDIYNLPDQPLNRMRGEQLRPPKETIDEINALMF
jgi:2-oxoglutarate ferredoxin oxidoreductase subunit beta